MMKIKQLHLQNYGRFEDLTIDFAPTEDRASNVTVIVGNNGAGKSQILQALAIVLSQFVTNLTKKNRLSIENKSILNGKNESEIGLTVSNLFNEISWKVYTRRNDSVGLNSFDFSSFNDFVESYKNRLNNPNILITLPLIIFYPVERAVLGESEALVLEFDNNPLDGYQNAFQGSSIQFSNFLQWFRQQEDIENENQKILSKKITKTFELFEKNKSHEILDDLIDSINRMEVKQDSILEYTRQAIEDFTEFKNIQIKRQGTPTMIVEKDGEDLDVNQLSQGEKSLLALVGDIARRLAILNPSLDDPLQGEGVVMIDEVDLHLHPKWQHDLIDKLVKTFPNVQFILTTHSPHIVSDRQDILVYSLDNGQLEIVGNVYGEDANTVLNNVFHVSERTPEMSKAFNDIRRAISYKELEYAENQINDIAKKVSSGNTELLKVKLMLAQAKLAQHKAS